MASLGKRKSVENRVEMEKQFRNKRLKQELCPNESPIETESKLSLTIPKIKKRKLSVKHSPHKTPKKNHIKIKSQIKCESSTEKKYVKKTTKKLIPSDNKKRVPVASSSKSSEKEEDITRFIDMISQQTNLDVEIINNVNKLLEEDATIPFIIRYRNHLVGGIDAEMLRNVKNCIAHVRALECKKAQTINKLEKKGKLTEHLQESINCATTLQELNYIYEPYITKKQNKVNIGIELGLNVSAWCILKGECEIRLEDLIKHENKELNNTASIFDWLVVLICNIISNDSEVLGKVRNLKNTSNIMISSQLKSGNGNQTKEDYDNFKGYSDFSIDHRKIRSHQFLAINRGVAKGILTMKLILPDSIKDILYNFVQKRWLNKGCHYPLRKRLLNKSFDVAYNKKNWCYQFRSGFNTFLLALAQTMCKVAPFIQKLTINEVKEKSEKVSLEVFAANLKWLLLAPPVRGETVLAIDPGYSFGCKVAIVSPAGIILETELLYLTTDTSGFNINKLVDLVIKHRVTVIGIGNGKGCRDVEKIISDLMKGDIFQGLDINYLIVNEEGVSTYSCSNEAMLEFPHLDPKSISAVSLARRIQDPLCELVKVEPKHLGIGMYQHDICEKKLESELKEVVSECVSLVGVDLNTAPLKLLSHVSGLSEKKAKSIIDWRNKNGPYKSRSQLKEVKGIGPKTFEQCIGFVKIIPETAISSNLEDKKEFNPFDQTDIHPEFYGVAERILKTLKLNKYELGSENFILSVKNWIKGKDMEKEFPEVGAENLKIITDAFTSILGKDMRLQFGPPIFQSDITSIEKLTIGQRVTGRITNVTHFGAFVDIGTERKGLIPTQFAGNVQLRVGNRVAVKVLTKNVEMKKISLSLISIL